MKTDAGPRERRELRCITNKVREEIVRGNIGSDLSCPYHPSHYRGQNCSFCYCPFYPCNDTDLGALKTTRKGDREVWDCSSCLFIHRNDVVEYVFKRIRELGITEPDDPRFEDIFRESKERFFKKGKAIMVLGATSDAGKSIIVTAICRLLNERGYSVTPFKSQNMSLNSRATRTGEEISMIQDLQCKAAGIRSPSYHVNPILLKPKGDCVSQVIAEGVPYGDYDVKGYYSDFVPNKGADIVRRNIDFLKNRYDFVVMEGAGSPAEINIYDMDIANMRAAEMADADCILVINMEWGGSFAYALGTVELLKEKDRKRIKGIIFNNLYGKTGGLKEGTNRIEKMLGIPVLGIVPHLDIKLPKEDSECFRDKDSVGTGKKVVSVIRLPRIANFTDLDPLLLEDVTIRYVRRPEDLQGSDAIIIPGTKNTLSDLNWMKTVGLDKAVISYKGKIPIVGICGGYQIMGKRLLDPNGIEDADFPDSDGLGLLDIETTWSEYSKRTIQQHGKFILTGEDVTGYELHMGKSVSGERPLFHIESFVEGDFDEGASRPDEKIFGTYLHGIFEKPAFRRYFMSMLSDENDPKPRECTDYDEDVNLNIDKLAKGFEKAIDMDLFERLFMGGKK